jgi:hypothetical protein
MKSTLPILISIVALTGTVKAQSISPQLWTTAGTANSTSGYMLSYSIGEPLIETYANSDFVITQGFQQTDTILITNTMKMMSNTSRVYPNPFKDIINVETHDNAILSVINVTGETLLRTESLHKGMNQVSLSTLASGLYTIRITESNGSSQSIRIEKLK